MTKDYNEIKKNLKESGKLVYWFDDNGKILLITDTKNKENIKKNKYNGLMFRFNITFHSGKKPGQGGPIAVNVRMFNKENNIISSISGYKNGVIWFPLDYLESRGWNKKYMKIIHSIVTRKKFEFKIGIYNYDEL
jgi:hypothetical protein